MKLYKPIIHSSWFKLDAEFTKKVEIFCDAKITDVKPKKGYSKDTNFK